MRARADPGADCRAADRFADHAITADRSAHGGSANRRAKADDGCVIVRRVIGRIIVRCIVFGGGIVVRRIIIIICGSIIVRRARGNQHACAHRHTTSPASDRCARRIKGPVLARL